MSLDNTNPLSGDFNLKNMKLERVSINEDFGKIQEYHDKVKEENRLKEMVSDKAFEFAKENFLNKKGEPKWFLKIDVVAWAKIGWRAIQLFLDIFRQIKKERGEIGTEIGNSELDNM